MQRRHSMTKPTRDQIKTGMPYISLSVGKRKDLSGCCILNGDHEMLSMNNTWLFVLGVIAIICLSYSEPPATYYNNHTHNDQHGSIFAIKLQTTSDTKSTQTHKPNAEEKLMDWLSGLVDFRLTDFLPVIFTWVLATKTSGLYDETAAMRTVMDEQRSDMLRSIEATEILAAAAWQSADVAERSLFELERPWLFLDGAAVKIRDDNKPNSWIVRFNWNNVGRSPAIIQDSIAIVANKKILEPIPDYGKMAINLSFRKTMPAGVSACTAEFGLDPSQWDEEQKVAYGFIKYKGMGTAIYTSGFALEISVREEKFSLYDNENYTYYT